MTQTDLEDMKPSFLPVTKEVYHWYMCANKHWEIRKYGRWNERTVVSGRDVWVSKGYSGPRFLAVMGDNIIGSLDQILDRVPYDEIIPLIGVTEEEAKDLILAILKSKPDEDHIAFEVEHYWI